MIGVFAICLTRQSRSVDFCGRNRNAIIFPKDVISRYRLTIDADQVVAGLSAFHLDLEELLDRRVLGDFQIIRKARSIVINVENSHCKFSFRN